jgi:branched-chain amino acid transport system ATP-binding protein
MQSSSTVAQVSIMSDQSKEEQPGAQQALASLSVQRLGVEYGALVALADVSWSVGPGELLGIIGPNGAGKSSCFEAVTAMVTRSGTIQLQGRDITAVPPYELAALGIKRAFQQNAFFDDLSVLENLLVVLGKQAQAGLLSSIFNPWGAKRKREAARVFAVSQLTRFGIGEQYQDLSPKDIPYGVQRMLSIALAFGAGAEVLMLDEPAAGLGGEDMSKLIAILNQLKAEGVALIVIEHHMDLIMAVADRICVLDFGRQIAYDTPAAIQANPLVREAYLGKAA